MHGSRDEILANLDAIRQGIARGAEAVGRDPADVQVVAAAKTVPIAPIRWVVEAGVEAIGENYVKDLRAVHGEVHGVRWHFIGTLQTNTAHHVAALADVVETVTGDRATERLARRAASAGRTLDALMEVDYTGERSGVPPEEAEAVANRLAGMDGLHLRGLMTLPPLTPTAEEARPWFARLRSLQERIRERHPDVVDLSMGMSLDYRVAVEEGATMVRIGTALFGARTTRR
jgi:pyridoxal phosphate enzyme (YggS family)